MPVRASGRRLHGLDPVGLKCRANWREVQRTEITAADGAPLPPPPTGVLLVPAALDPAEWEHIVSKQQAALLENDVPGTVQ